ncbi:MAG: glycogen/starch synthase [Candidatus Omnitrophota bacterium]
MKVAFCSSEVFPFAKTGGLADVSGALPFALAKKDCQVKVFMPFYKNIKPQKVLDNYGYTKQGKVEFYFIKNDAYFKRDALYGTPAADYPDNLERFSYYSKEVLNLLKILKFKPQVVHCNDWQSSLANIYIKTLYSQDPFFKNTRTVLTIHNLAYQGVFDAKSYQMLGIPQEYFSMNYLEFYGKVNLLKGGIIFSDYVNTVSPTYARQIQTSEYGCGLDGVLREKGDRLCGILNAIDYGVWNPKSDKLIYKKYTSESIEDKYVNKTKFQKDLGLKVDKNVLFLGMVSRLAEQKGVDILSQALDQILKHAQVVILGFGDEKYHKLLKNKAAKFKNSFSLNLKFDEDVAHRIYASCDCFLLPSRFEPCGLSQMISYKYATIPIVHATGGLVDTVTDVTEKGGGIVFSKYSSNDLLESVKKAGALFKQRKTWQALIKKVTRYNFSWETTADKYIDMYKNTVKSSEPCGCSS